MTQIAVLEDRRDVPLAERADELERALDEIGVLRKDGAEAPERLLEQTLVRLVCPGCGVSVRAGELHDPVGDGGHRAFEVAPWRLSRSSGGPASAGCTRISRPWNGSKATTLGTVSNPPARAS